MALGRLGIYWSGCSPKILGTLNVGSRASLSFNSFTMRLLSHSEGVMPSWAAWYVTMFLIVLVSLR